MHPLLPLLTAFATGFVHALAPDHVAAVGTFVSRRPRPAESLRFGARWGLGHSLSVMLAGGLLVLLDLRVPELVVQNMERAVGAMLLALGVWLLWSLAHERAHRRLERAALPDADGTADGAAVGTADRMADRAGVDAGAPDGRGRDRQGSFVVGMAHGLAGTAPLVGIVPVAFIEPREAALAYLALFSAGTIAAMALFAGAAGLLLHATGRASPGIALGLRFSAGIGSTVLGAVWILSA